MYTVAGREITEKKKRESKKNTKKQERKRKGIK